MRALTIAGTFLLTTAGLWLFQQTLGDTLLDKEQMRQAIIAETVIHLGRPGPGACSVDLRLSTWERMNELRAYAWVAACEEAQRAKPVGLP